MTIMRVIKLTEEDFQQVKSILLTHAEMTDQQSLHAESEMGLRIKEFPNHDSSDDLNDIQEMKNDVDNLKRIASLFD